jgi:hypothetical protein
MAHEVSTDETHRMINVRYRGNISIDTRRQAMHETLALLEASGFRRILIDYVDAQYHLGTFAESNAFASTISNQPLLRQCRIAFVGSQGQQFNAVIETLADARRYPFRRFFDRESALAWLMTDAPAIGLLQD